MQIKILSVGPVVKEGKYFQYQLAYTDKGKDFKRNMVSFDKVPYEAFKDAKEGEVYDVTIKKDDNGFWKWIEVAKADGTAPAKAAGGETGRAGNWETAEERARRQVLIVRQSCLAQAINFLQGKDEIGMTQVQDVAEAFETWVNRE